MSGIDIVIPHVDGAAPGYEELCRRHTSEFVPCQLRDLGELRYVLRSIETNLAGCRIVLVVQTEAHLPAWLRRDTIRVVRHDEFIPADLLPTFHWATIVAHLHRIPDLAEQHVVWEDDVVLGRRLDPRTFFADDGLLAPGWETSPIVPGLAPLLGTYQRNLEESARALRRITGRRRTSWLFAHAPLAATRTSWARFHALFAADPAYRDTVTRRSRGDEHRCPTVDPCVLYANWVECELRRRGEVERVSSVLGRLGRAAIARLLRPSQGDAPRFAKYPVVNDAKRMAANMRRLLAENAVFANVNDEAYDGWEGEGISPASVAALEAALGRLFPDPCRHEL